MAQTPPDETQGFIWKLLMFIAGSAIGLGTKLANLNVEKKLTLKIGIYHLLMALSATWVTWFFLKKVGADDLTKMMVSVPVGRYSDSFFIFIVNGIKKHLKSLNDDVQKIDIT